MKGVVCFALCCLLQLTETKADGVGPDIEKLYLLTILPYPSTHPLPSWGQGYNLLPAAYLAVDMINERNDVLRGFRLELINSDGGCDIANRARNSFVRHIIAERGVRPVVGIIGPGCSTSTLAISSLSSHPVISLLNLHLARTPRLQNRTSYGYSFGLLGASYDFAYSAAALIHKANWKQVVLLYEKEMFKSVLEENVSGTDIRASVVSNDYIPIEDLTTQDVNVIMVFTGQELAQKIMCLANKHHLHYPRYQFVWMGRNISDFTDTISFTYASKEYTCTRQDVQNVVYNSVFVNHMLQRHDDKLSKANITYSQFWEMYRERTELYNNDRSTYEAPKSSDNLTVQTNEYATLVFDAVWAIAMALSEAEKLSVNITEYGLKLGSRENSNMIRNILYSNEFEGVSGHIRINSSTGYAERGIEIGQGGLNNTYIHIGSIEDGILNVSAANTGIFHKGGLQLVRPEFAGFFSFITIIGLILILTTHAITIRNRKHPSVKAHSPKFNLISYIGLYIYSATVLLSATFKAISLDPGTYAIICQVMWGFLAISFTLFFAPICARTWRLYRIFIHYLNPGPLISDRVLFLFVGVYVGIMITIVGIWAIVDPYSGRKIPAYTTEEGSHTTRLSCECDYTFIWIGIIYVVLVSLLIATSIVSILTRNIKNQQYSTGYLRVYVYLYSMTWIIGLTAYYMLTWQGLDIHVDYLVLEISLVVILYLFFIVAIPPIKPILTPKLVPLSKTLSSLISKITSI